MEITSKTYLSLLKYSFFDKDKNHISTVIGHQYRPFLKPENAYYMRATYMSDDISKLEGLQVYHTYTPVNCEITNIDFEDTRTCALNPNQGNNILIEGCTFTRCATNITPVAIDFEDGWNLMQDYCVRGNEVIEPVGTADIVVVGGMNLQFEENKNFRFESRNCTPGTVIRDNNGLSGGIRLTNRLNTGYYRYCNNKNIKSIFDSDSKEIDLKVYDCEFYETAAGTGNNDTEFIRCIFDWNNKSLPANTGGIISGKFTDCTIKNYVDPKNNFIHAEDAYFENCKIENMNVNLNGDIKINNSKVQNLHIYNYTSDINLQIKNSDVENFEFNFNSWAKCSYKIEFENNQFKNNNRKNIFDDDFISYTDSKIFKISNKNNEYKNGTVLASKEVLNNKNIIFK